MAAHQAPLSLGFSRQEHWSGLPFPSPMPSNCFLLQAKYCVWEVLWVISASVWHYLPPERVYFCYWLRTGVSQYIQKMIRGEYSFKSVFKVCQYVTKLLRMSIKCSHLNSFLARYKTDQNFFFFISFLKYYSIILLYMFFLI